LYEEHVVLEAGVEVWFEAEVDDDGVVVAVDVGVDAVKALENLEEERSEGARERNAYSTE
jgi:hypothetical protein